MKTLQIRDLPDIIYETLASEAERQNRSLAQQAIVVLAKGLEVQLDRSKRRKELIEEMSKNPLSSKKVKAPALLVREDRNR